MEEDPEKVGCSYETETEVENAEVSENPESPGATSLLSQMSLCKSGDLKPEMVDTVQKFNEWDTECRLKFIKTLLLNMEQPQLSELEQYIRPMLQTDFIAHLPGCIVEPILLQLDAKGIVACETVSRTWRRAVARCQLWRKLIERRMKSDPLWLGFVKKRNWYDYFYRHRDTTLERLCEDPLLELDFHTIRNRDHDEEETYELLHGFYRRLYPHICDELQSLEDNWTRGKNTLTRINCQSQDSRGVYCLQYDDQRIVSGLRDNTIKLWSRSDLRCSQILSGHTGSVLCLQYNEKVIVSGSSDSTVRVWDIETGACLTVLVHHSEAVLHLRFLGDRLITCSKDRSVAIWDMSKPASTSFVNSIVGHRAAVNVIDFDKKYIVSASGDRTIKVWNSENFEYVRTLVGHRRGIACLQYKDLTVVSGSSDNTIRIWDITTGNCHRVLEGHDELVRCLRFDTTRIVSGAYDGKIKVWDMKKALDQRVPASAVCLTTLEQHQGRVFRLQFDDFQIISSSHDDTILIWNFLDDVTPSNDFYGGFRDATNKAVSAAKLASARSSSNIDDGYDIDQDAEASVDDGEKEEITEQEL